MKAIPLTIVLAAVAASVAAPFLLRHHNQRQLEQAEQALRQQASQLEALAADNDRLSKTAGQDGGGPALTDDQMRELARLRGAMGQLRKAAQEADQLRAARQAAQANYWPNEQLANAGYSSPEAALETMLLALRNGDFNSMQASLMPEMRDYQKHTRKYFAKTDEEMEAMAREEAARLSATVSGFRILSELPVSPDEVTFKLSFVGSNMVQKISVRRVGAEWKIGQMEIAGQE